MQGSAFSSPAKTDSGVAKRLSFKWSAEEQSTLLNAISQHTDSINWAAVSKVLPGRTGEESGLRKTDSSRASSAKLLAPCHAFERRQAVQGEV